MRVTIPHIFFTYYSLGAIHSSDLEKLFQIQKWLNEDKMKQLSKKDLHEIICRRFIEGVPDDRHPDAKKVMSPANAEKYVYVIQSFKDCPKARDFLFQHYDKYGEESKMKMNALYVSEFRTLSDEDKLTVLTAWEKDTIKTICNLHKMYRLNLFFSSTKEFCETYSFKKKSHCCSP